MNDEHEYRDALPRDQDDIDSRELRCSEMVDEWNPRHRLDGDTFLAIATDHGNDGFIGRCWSPAIGEYLRQESDDSAVEMCYPGSLSFLDHGLMKVVDFGLNMRELDPVRDAVEKRYFWGLVRRRASNPPIVRRFEADVRTCIELFRAAVAWRNSMIESSLYGRYGVRCVGWAHEVACMSSAVVWMVTDPEYPLTLVSDRPALYESLELCRRADSWCDATVIVRDAQDLTMQECVALVYPERASD